MVKAHDREKDGWSMWYTAGVSGGRLKTVGISELYVSGAMGDIIVTHSLGSCIGVALYDPEAKVGGLIHAMLPSERMIRKRDNPAPTTYVDTGLSRLLEDLFAKGASRRSITATVVGGASIMDQHESLDIGRRNYVLARKVLWKNDILITEEKVGGHEWRSLMLVMETGLTHIRSGEMSTLFAGTSS